MAAKCSALRRTVSSKRSPKGKGVPTWAASAPCQPPVTWISPALSLSVLLSDQSPSVTAMAQACLTVSAS
jgi:hypothetical protein